MLVLEGLVGLHRTVQRQLLQRYWLGHRLGDQPWVFFGRNDAKAETPVLWPLHAKELTRWKGL